MDKLIKCIAWPDGVVLSEDDFGNASDPDERINGYFITKKQIVEVMEVATSHEKSTYEIFEELGVENPRTFEDCL